MIYMFGAMAGLTGLFLFMKLFSGSIKRTVYTSIAFSIVYGLAATAVCAIIAGGLRFDHLESTLLAFAFAVISVLFVILGIVVVSLGNMSMYSMFTMLGSIVLTFVYGLVFRNELGGVTVFRWIAIALMLVSIIVPLFDEKGKKGDKKNKKRKILFWGACFAGFICNGFAGVVCAVQADVQNACGAIALTPVEFAGAYMLMTAGISAVLLLVLLLFKKTRVGVGECKKMLSVKPLVYSAGYGVSTAFANVFNIEATKILPATLTFPFVNGGVVIITALIGAIFFKEKTGLYAKIGLGLTLLSTILFVF